MAAFETNEDFIFEEELLLGWFDSLLEVGCFFILSDPLRVEVQMPVYMEMSVHSYYGGDLLRAARAFRQKFCIRRLDDTDTRIIEILDRDNEYDMLSVVEGVPSQWIFPYDKYTALR